MNSAHGPGLGATMPRPMFWAFNSSNQPLLTWSIANSLAQPTHPYLALLARVGQGILANVHPACTHLHNLGFSQVFHPPLGLISSPQVLWP